MPSREDYDAVGLLADAADEEDRLRLLDWLVTERGFGLDELVAAMKCCSLTAVAADYHLRKGPWLDEDEALARSGLSRLRLNELSLAAGFPVLPAEQPAFTDADLAALATFASGVELFSREEALHFVRVLGSSLARLAEAAVALFLNDVELPLRKAGGSDLELAQKNLTAMQLLEQVIGTLDPLLRRHMHEAINRARAAREHITDPDTARYAIGFVDLVGFTPMSAELSARDLGTFVRRFEDRALDLVAGYGARVVKLIGDEVMFVAVEANEACAAAEALMRGFSDFGQPITPRGGLAFGDVVARGGDYYGSVVNVAARIADLAVPLELLATAELAARATAFDFDPAGRRMLKGFETPVTVHSLVLKP